MCTLPRPNTRGVWRIRDSYANPRRNRGFTILSRILPTPQEENAVNIPLDRNRPANQIAHLTIHNQTKSVTCHDRRLAHPLINERAHTVLIIL